MMPSSSPADRRSAPPDPLGSAESQRSPTKIALARSRRTRGFAWSIGWPREMPAEEILRLSRGSALRPHRDGNPREDGAGTIVDRQRGGRGLAEGRLPVMVVKTPLRRNPGCGSRNDRESRRTRRRDARWAALVSAHTRTLIHTSAVEVFV